MKKIPNLFFMVGIICNLSIVVVGCSGLSSQSNEPSINKITVQGDCLKTSIYNPAQISTDSDQVNILQDEDFLKGVAYVSNSQWAYSSNASKKTLTEFNKLLSVTWISIIPMCYQEKTNSIIIDCPQDEYRPDDADIERVIDFAHQLGLKVMLTPHMNLKDSSDSWRGEIGFCNNDADWSQWFEDYTNFISHYADLAEKHQVDYFVVGSEYEMASHREAEWRDVVAAVRNVHRGPVTYSANYGEEAEETVQRWDALDAISIDGYYPLTAKKDPTVEALVEAWQPIAARLENLSQKWNKPIILQRLVTRAKMVQIQGHGIPTFQVQLIIWNRLMHIQPYLRHLLIKAGGKVYSGGLGIPIRFRGVWRMMIMKYAENRQRTFLELIMAEN